MSIPSVPFMSSVLCFKPLNINTDPVVVHLISSLVISKYEFNLYSFIIDTRRAYAESLIDFCISRVQSIFTVFPYAVNIR